MLTGPPIARIRLASRLAPSRSSVVPWRFMRHVFTRLAIVGVVAISSISLSPAQSTDAPLAFLVGEWKGKGWHDHGDGRVNRFVQVVSNRGFLDNKIVVSEQVAYLEEDPSRILFRSLIIYSFDADSGQFVARRMSPTGKQTVEVLAFRGETLTWHSARFDIDFSLTVTEGTYEQTGSERVSGQRVFEMKLSPQ